MLLKYSKYLLWIAYAYFSYLLLLITIQYIPLDFDVAFLRIKQDEIQLFHYQIAFFTHVYTSIFLMIFGAFQFSSYLRKKHQKWHRNIGKFYIIIILLFSGPSGLVMSYYANGGIISKTAFIILSVLWMLFTYLSFYYAKRLDFKKHQKFAIRSFALTLSAISLRLFKFIIVFLFQPLPMDAYRIVSWLGWTFNLLLAEIVIIYLFKKKLMELKLNRPICFFDLETTGVDVAKDRIVEISVFKVYPNGNKESKTWLVNPTIPIPPQTTAVHGITDEKVANEPTFAALANQVYNMIKDSDLAGFNSDRFDIPLLAEEMLRAGVDFDMKNRVSVDIQTIFHKKEERTLSAGYKFYCGESLENAHSAEADTMATYEILKAQLDRYPDLENDIKALSEFTTRKKSADFAGFIAYNKEEKEVFSFGKHKGVLVEEVLEKEPGYFSWLQNADFPLYTKKVLTAIKLRKLNTK